MQELLGIHHVTAITSSAERIYDFFTFILGMRLVKKTINQDDIHTYHLFFADDKGSPGTDITFFDFPNINEKRAGTNEISRTSFRVPSDAAIDYWKKRFTKYNVDFTSGVDTFGKKTIYFTDFDNQNYALISDENNKGVASGTPWQNGPIPNEFAITGLGPVFITVSDIKLMDEILQDVLKMRLSIHTENTSLYEMGEGGNGASLIVELDATLPRSVLGYGGVHHIAFRVTDKNHLKQWTDYLNNLKIRNSGFIDRFYFKSLYARIYPGILFEFATDGPGFIDDEEDYDILGETLALPPQFRHKREKIEKLVRPINTKRSNQVFKKEYL